MRSASIRVASRSGRLRRRPVRIRPARDHPSVRCHVIFDGPMDLRTADSRTAPGISADALAEHSPITLLERHGGNTQPLFIAKAGLDRPGINDSIDAFVARAAELGSPVTLETHPDGRHAFRERLPRRRRLCTAIRRQPWPSPSSGSAP